MKLDGHTVQHPMKFSGDYDMECRRLFFKNKARRLINKAVQGSSAPFFYKGTVLKGKSHGIFDPFLFHQNILWGANRQNSNFKKI